VNPHGACACADNFCHNVFSAARRIRRLALPFVGYTVWDGAERNPDRGAFAGNCGICLSKTVQPRASKRCAGLWLQL